MKSKFSGFTLIELSIVLVVIGLIVGGVLVGRDLIQAAKLRGIISQIDSYKAAVNTFRTKYNALPGDMKNAEQIWGTRATGCTSATAETVFSVQTCNGNGNGRLVNGALGVDPGGDSPREHVTFWQHLASAGLIKEKMMGVKLNSSLLGLVPGNNVPQVNGFNEAYITSAYENVWPYYGNTHIFKTGGAGFNARAEGPYLTVIEARSIDTKIDDGKPLSGSVMADYYSNGVPENRCITTTWLPGNPAYHLTNTGLKCNIMFKAGF